MMTTEAKANIERLSRQGPGAMVAFWTRAQRAKCERDAPHFRYLVNSKRGGNETPLADLGPCAHCPDDAE